MGWASEEMIATHNAKMESDAEYAEEFWREDAEYQAWFEWRESQYELLTDWFPDYRLDYAGYEEFSQPENFADVTDEDLPF